MDGVSTAAVIAGLVPTTQRIVNTARDLWNATSSLGDLGTLITGFSNSCTSVSDLLQGIPAAVQHDISTRDARFWTNLNSNVVALGVSVGNLEQLVTSLQRSRDGFGGQVRTAARMQWDEGKIGDATNIARDLQSQVSIMLNLLNM